MTRHHQIHLRVTAEIYEQISANAAAAGKTVSEYLRAAGTSGTRCAHCGGTGIAPAKRRAP